MEIETKIKNTGELEFPNGLHGKIVRRVMIYRYRFPFLAVFGLVIFNLIISGWRVQTVIAKNEVVSIFSSFFSNFDFDYNSITDFLGMLKDYLPLHTLSIFVANLLFVIYISKLYFDVRKYDGYAERSGKTI